ncbi:MAG: RluA family pseudouridine synthase [Eubacteriales bacterium]|nr:RluA family pseudouridine synthase [Eubacteriales bacterium]MDY2826379.1 RluA family pseudouridine synthase [Eubacteriales bacterium]
MKIITVGKNDAGQRLDKFLLKAVRGLPLSLLYKDLRTKKIKLNGKRTTGNALLTEGDEIRLFIKDEFFDAPDESDARTLGAIRPKLSVVFEDENLMILNKRPGVLVHEDADGGENTLILHIKAYLYGKGEYDPAAEQSFAPALCNRIDRNTGGMVIAAKNAAALRDMNERIREGEISKFYLAAVHGKMEKREATLCAYLRKDSAKNQVTVHDTPFPGAKKILTRYRVLAEKNGRSLLEVELLTGRTHQIRAHLSHIGHPLLGDGKYGHNEDDRKMGYKYQALYAYRLRMDFSQKGGVLDYLRGREFRIPREDVWFLRDFDGART